MSCDKLSDVHRIACVQVDDDEGILLILVILFCIFYLHNSLHIVAGVQDYHMSTFLLFCKNVINSNRGT